MVPGGEASVPAGGSAAAPAAGGGGEGGLAGALASALAARKSKVSQSGKSPYSTFCVVSDSNILQTMRTTRMTGSAQTFDHSLPGCCFSRAALHVSGARPRFQDTSGAGAFSLQTHRRNAS